MVVADQYLPFLPPMGDAVSDDFATPLEPSLGHSAPEDIGSSIDRIGEQPMHVWYLGRRHCTVRP